MKNCLRKLSQNLKKASDTLAMQSKANNYINEMRMDDALSQLGKDIREIRFNIPKGSDTLFGEDVSKRVASLMKKQRYIRTSSSYSSALPYYKSKKSYTPYNSKHKEFPRKTNQLLCEEVQGPIQQELQVRDIDIKKLHDLAEKFKTDNIKFHLENWKKLTSNKYTYLV